MENNNLTTEEQKILHVVNSKDALTQDEVLKFCDAVDEKVKLLYIDSLSNLVGRRIIRMGFCLDWDGKKLPQLSDTKVIFVTAAGCEKLRENPAYYFSY
jgi:hypothetical protein